MSANGNTVKDCFVSVREMFSLIMDPVLLLSEWRKSAFRTLAGIWVCAVVATSGKQDCGAPQFSDSHWWDRCRSAHPGPGFEWSEYRRERLRQIFEGLSSYGVVTRVVFCLTDTWGLSLPTSVQWKIGVCLTSFAIWSATWNLSLWVVSRRQTCNKTICLKHATLSYQVWQNVWSER